MRSSLHSMNQKGSRSTQIATRPFEVSTVHPLVHIVILAEGCTHAPAGAVETVRRRKVNFLMGFPLRLLMSLDTLVGDI